MTEGAGAMTLHAWTTSLDVALGFDVEDLVAAGIARDDVAAYAAARADSGVRFVAAPAALEAGLHTLSGWWPQMRVRDALGWVLVYAWVPRLAEAVRAGVDAVGEDGWLFEAAGLSADEARARIAAGTVDEDALVTLAALRGVPVPVTV